MEATNADCRLHNASEVQHQFFGYQAVDTAAEALLKITDVPLGAASETFSPEPAQKKSKPAHENHEGC